MNKKINKGRESIRNVQLEDKCMK